MFFFTVFLKRPSKEGELMKVFEHYWEHSKEVHCDGQAFQPRREGSGEKSTKSNFILLWSSKLQVQ